MKHYMHLSSIHTLCSGGADSAINSAIQVAKIKVATVANSAINSAIQFSPAM
jgi:hypothetical protein